MVYAGTSDEWKSSSLVDLEGNKIRLYEEQPKKIKTHLTALMMGFLEPEVFQLIPASKVYWSLQENVFATLAKRNQLVGYLFSGRWRNIHKKEDLFILASS